MEAVTFDIEYHADTPELTNRLKEKIRKRFEKLSRRHRDITGASLAVGTISGGAAPAAYRVRLVAYHRPDNIAATAERESVRAGIYEVLGAVERQIREHRDKLHARHRTLTHRP